MKNLATMLTLTLILLSLPTISCGVLSEQGANSVVTHTKVELSEFRNESIKQLEKAGDRITNKLSQKLDESTKKAAEHIGTAVKEVLDADVIAFAAIGMVGLSGLGLILWFILASRRDRRDKIANTPKQNKLG